MGTGGARSRFEAEKKGRGFFWWFLLGGERVGEQGEEQPTRRCFPVADAHGP